MMLLGLRTSGRKSKITRRTGQPTSGKTQTSGLPIMAMKSGTTLTGLLLTGMSPLVTQRQTVRRQPLTPHLTTQLKLLHVKEKAKARKAEEDAVPALPDRLHHLDNHLLTPVEI